MTITHSAQGAYYHEEIRLLRQYFEDAVDRLHARDQRDPAMADRTRQDITNTLLRHLDGYYRDENGRPILDGEE